MHLLSAMQAQPSRSGVPNDEPGAQKKQPHIVFILIDDQVEESHLQRIQADFHPRHPEACVLNDEPSDQQGAPCYSVAISVSRHIKLTGK